MNIPYPTNQFHSHLTGEISTYILRRDNIEIYRGDATEYDDNNGIQPYQHYTYVLGACTAIGCASSPAVSMKAHKSKETQMCCPLD